MDVLKQQIGKNLVGVENEYGIWLSFDDGTRVLISVDMKVQLDERLK